MNTQQGFLNQWNGGTTPSSRKFAYYKFAIYYKNLPLPV